MHKWQHAPDHRFHNTGTYIVTGATYQKALFFRSSTELDLLQELFLSLAEKYQWRLAAWALFPNHYHFIAHSPSDPSSLRKFITHLHANSAKQINILHNTPGRKVWFQFWDTQLNYHTSYLARLNYVMQNPVKHKLVEQAIMYKWCSAGWFETTAEKSYLKTVTTIKTDKIVIIDDF